MVKNGSLRQHLLGALGDNNGLDVNGRLLRGLLKSLLSLLLLGLKTNSSDNLTFLNPFHQMGGVTSDLVSESLGLDFGHFF